MREERLEPLEEGGSFEALLKELTQNKMVEGVAVASPQGCLMFCSDPKLKTMFDTFGTDRFRNPQSCKRTIDFFII